MESVFKPLKRLKGVKRHFDELAQDGNYSFSPEKFRNQFLQSSFEHISNFNERKIYTAGELVRNLGFFV